LVLRTPESKDNPTLGLPAISLKQVLPRHLGQLPP